MACADDRGGVLLFNYPAVVESQPYDYYPGHSSHVANVKWLLSGETLYLISAGGHDRSLFQWRFVRDEPKAASKDGCDPPPPLALPAPITRGSRHGSQGKPVETPDETPGEKWGKKPIEMVPGEGEDAMALKEEMIRSQEATIAQQTSLIEQLHRRLLDLEQKEGR